MKTSANPVPLNTIPLLQTLRKGIGGIGGFRIRQEGISRSFTPRAKYIPPPSSATKPKSAKAADYHVKMAEYKTQKLMQTRDLLFLELLQDKPSPSKVRKLSEEIAARVDHLQKTCLPDLTLKSINWSPASTDTKKSVVEGALAKLSLARVALVEPGRGDRIAPEGNKVLDALADGLHNELNKLVDR